MIGVISELISPVTLVIGERVPFEPPGFSVPEVSCPEGRRWSGVFSLLFVLMIVLSTFWDVAILVCTEVGCSLSPRLVYSWSIWVMWRDPWGCGEFVLG